MKGGVEKNVAWANAKLFGQFYEKYGAKNNQEWDKWFNKLDVEYNVPANERNARFQSAMKRSEFSNFDNFYNDVINNKKKNTDKKQFNAPTADGLNIRVPHDTVLHSEKEHTLTSNEWKDLLSNIDNIESAVKSHQKPRYSGIPVLLKVKTNNGCYGVVLEIFKKNNPIITTAFTDVESEIDNWIKVEAIPNGTETTFSDTRLNNIITHYAPNFKPKTYNETLYQSAVTAGAETSADNQGTFDESNPNIYYQSAYHGSPVKFDKFDHDYIGSGEGAQVHGYGTYVAESKHIADERYRERLVENKSAIEVGGDVYYLNNNGSWSSQDGEEYWDSDTYYGYVLDVFNRTEDKEKSIKWLQDDLDEVLADKQEFIEENDLDGKLLEINSDNGFVNDGGEEYFDTIDEYLQRELRDYDDRISTYMRAVEVLQENDIKMYQGQLYEVEIPEDEEMLDEDLSLSEQPQKVQDAFGEMIKADQNGQLILLDSDKDESETPITSLSIGEIVSENPNGKKIYDRISSTIADVYGVDYAEADKLASELLNRYGIKGIKYDGQIDGQCYVIFNPENIDITRTFYQEGVENSENINIDKDDYINAEKDIPLPNINHQVLKNLGKKDKPLILKSNIIKKNKKNHPEILIEEYNDILSKGLQSTDLVFKTDNKNEYYNFIHFDNSTNEQILVELSENKDNYEIVNFYKFSDKSLERKIKNANNEGGQFLITDSNAKGAAVLSALEVSPNNIITINSQNLNPEQKTFLQNENEKFIAGYSYQEVMDKLSGLYDKLDANENSEEQNQDIMAQIHVLEDAYEVSENPDNYSSTQVSDAMLNAYYVMNNQKLPQDFLETDKKSERTYSDLLNAHNEKKEKQIKEYHGYFAIQRKNFLNWRRNK